MIMWIMYVSLVGLTAPIHLNSCVAHGLSNQKVNPTKE